MSGLGLILDVATNLNRLPKEVEGSDTSTEQLVDDVAGQRLNNTPEFKGDDRGLSSTPDSVISPRFDFTAKPMGSVAEEVKALFSSIQTPFDDATVFQPRLEWVERCEQEKEGIADKMLVLRQELNNEDTVKRKKTRLRKRQRRLVEQFAMLDGLLVFREHLLLGVNGETNLAALCKPFTGKLGQSKQGIQLPVSYHVGLAQMCVEILGIQGVDIEEPCKLLLSMPLAVGWRKDSISPVAKIILEGIYRLIEKKELRCAGNLLKRVVDASIRAGSGVATLFGIACLRGGRVAGCTTEEDSVKVLHKLASSLGSFRDYGPHFIGRVLRGYVRYQEALQDSSEESDLD